MTTDDVMSKLSKKTRQRMKLASEVTIEKLPLASVGLTNSLGGGLPRGRIVTLWGSKSASKTSLLLQTAGMLQRDGSVAGFIDAEGTYDPTWSEKLGVDNSRMLVSSSKSIEAMTTDVCELAAEGVDFIIVDSVSALLPSAYYEKDTDGDLKEGLGGTKQIGTLSKELSNSLMKINSVNERSVVVFISQARNTINTWGAVAKPQGGHALSYFSSVVVKLFSSAADREQIKGETTFGNNVLEIPVGRPVQYTIEYSKTSPPGLAGKYDFYYDGDEIGIDVVGEAFDLAVSAGVIEKGGAGWYTFEGTKLQGRPSMVSFLKEDPEAYNLVLEKLKNV